jgi:hypothetical protein
MLLADLMAAESQRANGVGSGTKGKKEKESGYDGANTVNAPKTPTTFSSKTYPQVLELDSLAPLPQLSIDDSFQNRTKDLWLQAQWKRLWQNWVRSLGQMWGTTPPMATQMEESTQAFQDNLEA